MKSFKNHIEEAEMSLYDKIKAARANPSPDKPVRGRGSKNRNPKTYNVRNTLDKEDDRIQAMVKKKLKKEEAEQIDEISKDLAGRYIKKAQISTADAGRDTMDSRKKIRDRGIHKIVNRRIGTSDAIRKLTGKARVPATESVELDEVLDTPKAMDSYKNKAKASKEKAAGSAAAKILRGKNADGSRADHSLELKTMAKREKGLKMADRNAKRKTFKALRKEK